MNPVHAGMVNHPGEYRWSNYQVNEQDGTCDLIAHHSLYLDPGYDNPKRQVASRELFRQRAGTRRN